jgi:hypothetical protein
MQDADPIPQAARFLDEVTQVAFSSSPDRWTAIRRDEKMSKEELIQFEGLVIEILPDGRYSVQLDDGYEVVA